MPLQLPPAGSRRFDVAGFGQNSIDLVARVPAFPTPNSKQHMDGLVWMPGGQVASAMVGCARLGWRACYIGRFGSDELGARGRDSLEREGVVVEASVAEGARSRLALVLVDARTGDRTVLWDRDPALNVPPDVVPDGVIRDARVLLVDCDDLPASIRAAEIARASGVVTVVDVEAVLPGVETLLPLIDVIIASEGFPEAFTGEPDRLAALQALQRRCGAALVCVTLGAHGSVALVDGDTLPMPAFPITCVDSTGAGDAFRAGFISALLRWGVSDPPLLFRYANAVAGLTCRAAGARDGLPGPEEVDALLTVASSQAQYAGRGVK